MTQPRTQITRELDRRTGGGIEVRLPWCQNDGHVTVAVTAHAARPLRRVPIAASHSS
jgi:hypothetical protein